MKPSLAVAAAVVLLIASAQAQWTDTQPAQRVIGQPNFTSNASALTRTGLGDPQGVAIDVEHGKLYVADAYSNRVLRYAWPVTSNMPAAEVVFGQSSFTTDDPNAFFNQWGFPPAPTASQLIYPMSLAVDHGDLWVDDSGNYRILRFASAYSTAVNGATADLVIGQKDFVTREYPYTPVRNRFGSWSIFVDKRRTLWVADGSRVLRFDSAYVRSNGCDADQVIGQPDFWTSNAPSSPTSGNISLATSVWVDGTTLWVCDRSFNRVLRFDSATAKGNGGTADGVLGQTSFTTSTTGRTRNTFEAPSSVCVDNAGTVYVGDMGNLRIMIFKHGAAKANGGNADNLLGQDGYFSSELHMDSIGFNGSASVRQLAVDTTNALLAVADRGSYRVLAFAAYGPLTGVPHTSSLPQTTELAQNYPNPFNPNTGIRFQVSGVRYGATSVSIKVFDLLGREVATLVNEQKAPGTYEVRFDGSKLASGVYLCRMIAGDIVQTRKLLLLK